MKEMERRKRVKKVIPFLVKADILSHFPFASLPYIYGLTYYYDRCSNSKHNACNLTEKKLAV